MKRVSKAILITASLLVMGSAVAIYAVNRYVQSPAARLRIQTELSEASGLPLEITKASFGWSGLQLSGVSVPAGTGHFLEAPSFHAEYRLLPLLSRRLVVSRMTLESPRIVWMQNAEGKWVLPALPKKEKEQPAGAEPKKPGGGGFKVTLQQVLMTHGTIDLLDAAGQRVVLATEVTMRSDVAGADSATGTLEAGEVAWGNFLRFTDLRSQLMYAHGELRLMELRADLTGGKVQGSLTVQTDDPEAPFAMELTLERVDLGRLATEAGWPPGQAAGALGGTAEWHGSFREMDRTEAKGHLTIAGGHFQQLDLFQSIGSILQIPQLADLRGCTGTVDFTFGDDKTTLAPLILETGDVAFQTSGTVKTDGKMKLQARLSVSEKITQQLPSFVRSNLGQPDAQHRYGIDFDVTGQTDKPKTNLVNRIIGTQVNGQLNDLLGSVFGSGEKKKDEGEKKKKKDKKKKDDPALPEAAPAPAPPPAPAEPAEPAAPR